MDSNVIASPENSHELELLEQFRNRLEDIGTLNCPLDDVYLLRFLRYSKLDVERSINSIIKWWEDRHRVPAIHDEIYPSKFLNIYGQPPYKKFMVPLAHRDEAGRQIVLFKPGNWNTSEYSFLGILKSNYPIMDTITIRQLTQTNGVIMLVDFKEFGISHVSSIRPWEIKTLISCMDGFPIKVKAIHMINHSIVFNSIWAIAKVTMKPKIKERVHFHGYNYKNSLHKYINPSLLPEIYGGTLSENDHEESNFFDKVVEREEYFRDLFDNRGMKSYLDKLNQNEEQVETLK